MGQVDGVADLDVVGQRDVLHLDTRAQNNERYTPSIHTRRAIYRGMHALLCIPLPEELDFLPQLRDILGQSGGGGHFRGSGDLRG